VASAVVPFRIHRALESANPEARLSGGPNKAIYGEVTRLVPIHIGGLTFEVPDDIPLIRAFQYIQFELGRMTCDWSRFCFNDTIGCCAFEYRLPEDAAADWGRACCQRVVPGLVVATLPKGSVMLDETGAPISDIPAAPPAPKPGRRSKPETEEHPA
jgi:hypothetical protein